MRVTCILAELIISLFSQIDKERLKGVGGREERDATCWYRLRGGVCPKVYWEPPKKKWQYPGRARQNS